MKFQYLAERKIETVPVLEEFHSFSVDMVHVRVERSNSSGFFTKLLTHHLQCIEKKYISVYKNKIQTKFSSGMNTAHFLNQSEFFTIGHILNQVKTSSVPCSLIYSGYFLDAVFHQIIYLQWNHSKILHLFYHIKKCTSIHLINYMVNMILGSRATYPVQCSHHTCSHGVL